MHDPGDDTRIRLIREGLRERADPAKAPDMQRYMKSEMPFLGVQKAGRVALARAVFPREPSLDLVLTLWREAEYREERYTNRGDREFFIRKAIGWALRAYAWVEPELVIGYCETHELSPLSRREALKNVS